MALWIRSIKVHAHRALALDEFLPPAYAVEAAAFATAIFYPVETARTHIQVCDKLKKSGTKKVIYSIVGSQGWLALYAGLLPVLFTIMVGNCIYFFIFHGLKSTLDHYGIAQTAANDLSIGFFAGVVVGLVSNPLWVIIIRLRIQGQRQKNEGKEPHYNGLIDGLKKVIQNEGVGALWNGLLVSVILSLNPAINFMTYEAMRRALTGYFTTKNLGSVLYFSMGGTSKGISTFITYPLQIVQNRLRVKRNAESLLSGLFAAVRDLVRINGIGGLYLGLRSKLAQMILTAAFMFLFYEKITALVFTAMQVELHNTTHVS